MMPLTLSSYSQQAALVSKGEGVQKELWGDTKTTTFSVSCPLKISIFTFYNIPGILYVCADMCVYVNTYQIQ